MLVNVPAPARYALHKLVVAERRIAAFQTKTRKGAHQAEQLLQVLIRERPGDVRTAWASALKQPPKFMQQLRTGMRRLSDEMQKALSDLERGSS